MAAKVYTLADYRARLESYANLDWGWGSDGDVVVAALRIASRVMEPGVIEAAVITTDDHCIGLNAHLAGTITPAMLADWNVKRKAACIRTALTKDTSHD